MARLEWSLHTAHHAENATALDPAELAQCAPQLFDDAQLSLHPACRLIASDWAVVQLWQTHQADTDIAFPVEIAQPNYGLIVRPRWGATMLPLTRGGHAALSALLQGMSVGAALDAALAADPEFDFGASLQQWLAHGVFVAIQLPITT